MMPAVPGHAVEKFDRAWGGEKQPAVLGSLSPAVPPWQERENCLRNQMQDKAFMEMESL